MIEIEKKPFVSIKDVRKNFQMGKVTVEALKGVTLGIDQGEFLAIGGASGSGKSTLLNLIGCLDTVTSGEIEVNGKSLLKLKEKEKDKFRVKTIGFVFQTFNLIPVLNVYENVELPLLICKDVSLEERRKRVEHFIEAVGLYSYMKHKPAELSGGQRQRVAVARALVTHPMIVLADEPTANLDSKTGIEIIELMHDINRKENTTFIFSTHDNKVMERADRVVYVKDGVIVSQID
jgi:putative ABC transport system ATP-binding protein